MKKKLCATFLTILTLMLFATSAFADEARWRNVTRVVPAVSANSNTYSSVITGSEGTTKIDCTLILYEKNSSGTYSEISRCSSIYYGRKGKFTGTANIKYGTTYKLETIATVTCNGSNETISTSSEITC